MIGKAQPAAFTAQVVSCGQTRDRGSSHDYAFLGILAFGGNRGPSKAGRNQAGRNQAGNNNGRCFLQSHDVNPEMLEQCTTPQ